MQTQRNQFKPQTESTKHISYTYGTEAKHDYNGSFSVSWVIV